MPYDPRPVSEGGNRGAGEEFSFEAPQGMYRVIGVDTFDGTDWLEGDFATLELAQEHVNEKTKGKKMLVMHIYDDAGKSCGSGGIF